MTKKRKKSPRLKPKIATPVPREEVWELFWYWINERHSIFMNRLFEEKPWTTDHIFVEYKFTNVFRVLDRSSQFLLRNVQYVGNYDLRDTVFRTIFYKIFNLPYTWWWVHDGLIDDYDHPESDVLTVDHFLRHWEDYQALLDELMEIVPIYSPAYMLTGHKGRWGYDTKHHNHIAAFRLWFDDMKVDQILAECDSMEEMFNSFMPLDFIGKFLAMQFSIDLCYSPHFNHSENEFIIAGPGAHRGVDKMFELYDGWSDEDLIIYLTQRYEEEMFARYENPVHLFGRMPSLMDIQNCLCEIDKYTRVALPDLRVDQGAKTRHTLKNKFIPTAPSIRYMFPPKWELDWDNDL